MKKIIFVVLILSLIFVAGCISDNGEDYTNHQEIKSNLKHVGEKINYNNTIIEAKVEPDYKYTVPNPFVIDMNTYYTKITCSVKNNVKYISCLFDISVYDFDTKTKINSQIGKEMTEIGQSCQLSHPASIEENFVIPIYFYQELPYEKKHLLIVCNPKSNILPINVTNFFELTNIEDVYVFEYTSNWDSLNNEQLKGKYAAARGEKSECYKLDETHKYSCLVKIFISNKDMDGCKSIPEYSSSGATFQGYCLVEIAKQANDSSMCNLITTPNRKNECKMYFEK